MAINFSASFAACLAAGLKVPRQIMYCISQDTGAPYVLYKDSQDAGERTATLGGQWGSEAYPQIQQQQQQQQQNPQAAHIPAQLAPAQPPHSPPNQDGSGGQSQTEQQNGNLPSPATSPYPQNGEIEEDVNSINQVQTMQHQQQAQGQQQSSPGGNIEIPNEQQQQQQHQQQHQQAPQGQQQNGQPVFVEPTQAELNGYYAQRHPGAPQGTIMAPPGFPPLHHYLNKQGILPGMSGMEQSNGTLDGYSMPDLLHGNQLHHQTSPNTKPSKNSDLRLFKCLTCGKDFKQKSTLLQHERIHTDTRPYGCGECGKRFRQQSHLTQHLRIHANEKPFSCAYCPRSFRQRAILNQHIRIHSGEKPFICGVCTKAFRQKAILNQHVRTHQDVSPHLLFKNGTLWPSDIPFPEEPKDEQGNVIAQAGRKSRKGTSRKSIAIIFPTFYKDENGVNHSVTENNSGRSAGMPLWVRCPICIKDFRQKSTLLQHGCIHIESRPYPCGSCGKRFRQQSHLTQHLRIHTNEKPYGCVYCPRYFRQRTILNQHIRIHTGEKPYKCGQCGKDFRQKAILDQHTRTHQGDRPFCCPMPNCRRRFATEQEVKKHIDNHMNPNTKRNRTAAANAAKQEANNAANAAAAAAQFLSMDNKNNLIPRMGPVVKHELYFPQCYAPPFNQAFVAGANGTPNGAVVNGQQPQQQQQQQQQQQAQAAHTNSVVVSTVVTSAPAVAQ